MGPPEGRPHSIPAPAPARPIRFRLFHLLFGILLPFLTIAVEVFSGWSAEIYADPIPSRWLLLLILTVPLANLTLWLRFCLVRPPGWITRHPRWLDASNAIALAASALYSVLYLPIVPAALVLSVFVVGLLPLAPFFGLLTAIRMRQALRQAHPRETALARTGALALAIVAVVNVPGVATSAGLRWAASEGEQTRQRGVRLLRWLGDRGQMLRACHGRGGAWIQWGHGVTREQAQRAYYRVTGEAFDTAPPPKGAWRFWGNWDEHQGGEQVGNRKIDGLSLAVSQIDGQIDRAASTAQWDWTMEFHNASAVQAEARTVLALPAGGVVSRVTLWINGEPREAAFGGREQTRQAYEQVVRARRDPLLVTTAGPDRVLVQCFPVPPGESMKIRLVVAAPVRGRQLELPRLVESNFAAREERLHQVWLTGDSAVAGRRTLADADLERPLTLAIAPALLPAWTPDPVEKGWVMQQRWQPASARPRLIVVADASLALAPYAARIEEQLRTLHGYSRIERVLASDPPARVERFDDAVFEGGADNVPALELAQEMAGASQATAILWIHGPQPVELSPAGRLLQYWRRPGGAPLYAWQLAPGANQLLSALNGVREVRLLGPAGLASLAAQPEPVYTRVRGKTGVGARGSEAIAKLWAAAQPWLPGSIPLASAYRVVTPVSGAVVLENAKQYKDAGLQPPEAAEVPEPATLVLFVVGALGVLAVRRFRCQSSQ
ncbi:MAG: PEP-CTERM sorting domain-containing protein [Bryobacterales bacterium]|nr:PEP-CTERM sorting domain-containing protein [Bryobacterales bacterium]